MPTSIAGQNKSFGIDNQHLQGNQDDSFFPQQQEENPLTYLQKRLAGDYRPEGTESLPQPNLPQTPSYLEKRTMENLSSK